MNHNPPAPRLSRNVAIHSVDLPRPIDREVNGMASRSKTTAARCVVGTALGAAVALWGGTHLLSRRRARWRPGAGVVSRHGPLSIRTFGDGDPIVVLLPGIAASGSFYGAAFDQLGDIATVLVIDPLGFGQSMVEPDGDALFGISDHQNAIIDVLSSSPLASRPVTLVGHSMGASLAIITAAAAADTAITIAGVIAFDAPVRVRAGSPATNLGHGLVRNPAGQRSDRPSGLLMDVPPSAIRLLCRHRGEPITAHNRGQRRCQAHMAVVLRRPELDRDVG